MKLRLMRGGLIALVLVVFVGCSKDASGLGNKHAKLFQNAAPSSKALWDSAVAAMQTNGFVVASRKLAELNKAALSPEQQQAAKDMAMAVSDQMYEAANKGDAAAVAAIAELRKLNAR